MSAPTEAKHYRPTELAADRPLEGIVRRRLVGRQAMIAEVELRKGTVVTRHQHPNEQFARILSGRMHFFLGAEDDPERHEFVAEAGDVVHLPGGVVHGAEALEDAHVLDVLAPPTGRMGIDSQES